MRNLHFTICICFILICAEAYGADWKLAGWASLPKGEETIVFYDSESAEYFSDGRVRVWTKAITQSEMDLRLKEKEKQINEEAVKRIVSKYYPPYLVARSKDDVSMWDILLREVAANMSGTRTRAKVLYEINCGEKKSRFLSISLYDDAGVPQSDAKDGEWDYISPDSNMEMLQKTLCIKGKEREKAAQ